MRSLLACLLGPMVSNAAAVEQLTPPATLGDSEMGSN